MFLCPMFVSFYFWLSHLVFHRLTPALPGPSPEYLYLQQGLLLPFPYREWLLLQAVQAAVQSTVLMALHPALYQPFKGRAYFSAFPGLLPALCAKCALLVFCFYHNFSESFPGELLTCCWVGCACYTAGSCLLLRHRWKRWWGRIRLWGEGGCLSFHRDLSFGWHTWWHLRCCRFCNMQKNNWYLKYCYVPICFHKVSTTINKNVGLFLFCFNINFKHSETTEKALICACGWSGGTFVYCR